MSAARPLTPTPHRAYVYDAVSAGEVVNYKVTPVYEDGQLHFTAVVLQAEGSEGLSPGITIHNRNAQE